MLSLQELHRHVLSNTQMERLTHVEVEQLKLCGRPLRRSDPHRRTTRIKPISSTDIQDYRGVTGQTIRGPTFQSDPRTRGRDRETHSKLVDVLPPRDGPP